MHPLIAQASGWTHDVSGAAIEVLKDKGPLAAGIDLRMVPPLIIINFNELKLTDGARRFIIPGANLE
jgi:hypothetical protein